MSSIEPSDISGQDLANNNTTNNNNNIDNARVKQEHDCDERSNESTADNGISNESDDSEKTNLIVNYLPQQMTDDEFEDLFKKFGTMKSCKIVRNRVSGYSYGFGFVDFETHDQAMKAIEELNGHELENKKIKVAFARPAGQDIKQANLYIKNVPNNWTQEDVKNVFKPYGNIIQVRVLGNNRGVAFVLYDLRKQAEDALEALNGKTVEGCEAPFEIKFAADKKVEKGGGGGGGGNKGSGGTNSGRHRERGHRGGRNQGFNRNNRDQRQGRQSNQRSYFDRQNNNNFDNRRQYDAVSYGNQYKNNFSNDIGPVKQSPVNKMNRYTPFIPIQQSMAPNPAATVAVGVTHIAPQMAPNPTYGFPGQQPMIPFTMLPTQQMTPMQPINQTGQMAQAPMGMYGATQMPIAYAPVAPSNMNNIYSVASNNMNNAANMQPQIGQPMTMRSNANSRTNNDDGVTLFVYNIGPDADEDELRSMFGPYGQVTKCNVVRKTPGGETKGFGFVTLKDREQANSAIAGLNGSMRNGRALQVSLKK